MRRFLVLIAATVAFVLAGLGLALASSSPLSATKTSSPHFVCVAAWNLGVCIGPPTKQG